jgi:hypothetical protein
MSTKKLRNHPELSQRKEARKNMSAEAARKATAATAETIDEVFQEAMRSSEKAQKSGIQLQEESAYRGDCRDVPPHEQPDD